MKRKTILMAIAMMVTAAGTVGAESYYDDDIYFDASKTNVQKSQPAKKNNKGSDNLLYSYTAVSKNALQTTITTNPAGDKTTVTTTPMRNVDEYNRRLEYATNVKVTADSKVLNEDPYYYTRRISRFDNTELLNSLDDTTAFEVMTSDPSVVNITVNNYSYPSGWERCRPWRTFFAVPGWLGPFYLGVNFAWGWGCGWDPYWDWYPAWPWFQAWHYYVPGAGLWAGANFAPLGTYRHPTGRPHDYPGPHGPIYGNGGGGSRPGSGITGGSNGGGRPGGRPGSDSGRGRHGNDKRDLNGHSLSSNTGIYNGGTAQGYSGNSGSSGGHGGSTGTGGGRGGHTGGINNGGGHSFGGGFSGGRGGFSGGRGGFSGGRGGGFGGGHRR